MTIFAHARAAAAALACLMYASAWPGEAVAGDVAAGREKAGTCVPCHGLDGLSRQPDAPNIAGQVEMYMAQQLRLFRDGQRRSEIMNIIAAEFTDTDIADLAAYYAGIEITVTPPE